MSLKVTTGVPYCPQGQYVGLGGGSQLSPPAGFKRKETRGKLAIGITTNFINRHSRAEVEVAEISGVARIYNQKFFQNLYNKTGQWSPSPNPCIWGTGGSCPLLRELEAQPQDVISNGDIAGDIWCLSPVLGHPVALAQILSCHQALTWKTSCTTRMTLTILS